MSESPSVVIPAAIASKIAATRRLQVAVLERRLISWGLACLGLSFALTWISDRLWDTPAWLRALLLGSGLVLLLAAVIRFVVQRRRFMNDDSAIARLVEDAYPQLGDGLRGALELADGSRRPATASGLLVQAAIAQVAREVEPLDENRAVSRAALRRILRYTTVILALVGILALINREAFFASLSRWANPFAKHERFTFVQMQELPSTLHVAHGEDFKLSVATHKSAPVQPEQIRFRLDTQKGEQALRDGSAVLELRGVIRPGTLELAAQDWRGTVQIVPVQRPGLARAQATVILPAYLGRPPQALAAETGSLDLVSGSALSLEAAATSDLGAVTLLAPEPRVSLSKGQGAAFSLSTPALDKPLNVQLQLRDRLGFESAKPFKLAVRMKEDLPPSLGVDDLAGTVALLEDDFMAFNVRCRDDYGLQDAQARFTVQPLPPLGQAAAANPPPPAPERHINETMFTGRADLMNKDITWRVSPRQMKITAPSKITLVMAVRDYLPGRAATLSQTFTMYVVDKATHARLIAEKLKVAQSQLEELSRAEQEQARRVDKIAAEAAKADKDAKAQQARHDQAAKHGQERERQMDALSEDLAKLLKEAARNEEFDKEDLKAWMEALEKMKEMQAKSIPKADASLKKAEQSQGQPQEGQQSDEAAKDEQELAKEMQEAAAKLEKNRQKAQMKNIENRLRQLAKAEEALSQEATRLLPLALAGKKELLEIPLGALASSQDPLRKELGQIKELVDLIAAAGQSRFQGVAQMLEAEQPDQRMYIVQAEVAKKRLGFAASETAELAKLFIAMADKLKPPKKDGGGECKGEPKPNELVERLMKVILEEKKIMDRSRFMDGDFPADLVKAEAKILQELQSANQVELSDIASMVEQEDIAAMLGGAAILMDQASGELGQGSFGKAYKKEHAALEMIVNALQAPESESKPKQMQNKEAAMAMMAQASKELAQMAAQAQGNKPGAEGVRSGNNNAQLQNLAGASNDIGKERRSAQEGAASGSSAEVPVEYRRLYDSYLRRINNAPKNP